MNQGFNEEDTAAMIELRAVTEYNNIAKMTTEYVIIEQNFLAG
jgi:hypothetical protein